MSPFSRIVTPVSKSVSRGFEIWENAAGTAMSLGLSAGCITSLGYCVFAKEPNVGGAIILPLGMAITGLVWPVIPITATVYGLRKLRLELEPRLRIWNEHQRS